MAARVDRAQRRACRRRGLDARDTLILAFSHKGRRDPLTAVRTWFQMAGLAATVWIPAFAGMTEVEIREKGSADCHSRLISDGGLGYNRLDSRFRGNGGGRNRERWGQKPGNETGVEIGNNGVKNAD